MYKNHKIVVVTPSGRKRYMEILIEFILREKSIVDEYRIWINTDNKDDISWFEQMEAKYKGFVTLDKRILGARDDKNNNLYSKYKMLLNNNDKIILGGRLAEYKYYDMHHIIDGALNVVNKL